MMMPAMHKFCRCAEALAGAALLVAAPVAAQQDVTERDPDMIDAALTPLSDLNLARDPIPPILVAARSNPYANDGLDDCAAILSGIGDLDAVLGDDFDTRDPRERSLTPGGVAQRAVGMLIPFRGIIREISGANNHEFNFREAISAGLMRRAYLKGLGEARGCPYPARPARPEMLERLADGTAADSGAAPVGATDEEDGTRFVTRPVIQGDPD